MPSETLVLGFDTSAAHCAAALLSGDRCVAAIHEEIAKGQAERLMPMIQEILAQAQVEFSDLNRIGVGIGPGNFTGVRISVAAARGLALALDIPAIGVSLLDALAFGTRRPVLCTLNARRGQVHVQGFGTGMDMGPTLLNPDDIAVSDPDLICIGHDADVLALRLGASARPAKYAPASAIARIAAQAEIVARTRPAPIYLRPADAAPARDTGPAILP